MSTVYDAPMLDFSQEITMDADMLPSTTSDADWLQVENMVEDGDTQKPLPQEVDMIHDDDQEFEMRDADAEFDGDYGQVTSDDSRQLFRAEPQDQEIPDASRAPSPSPLQIPSFTEPGSVEAVHGSDQALQDPSADAEPLDQKTTFTEDPSVQNNEAVDESTARPADFSNEEAPLGVVVDASAADSQDSSTISGESTQQQEQQQQASEAFEHADEPEVLGNSTQVQPEQYDEALNEDPAHEEGRGVDALAENEVAVADDDGLLMDPPPSVLLSYPFDNSRFAFFNLPDTSHAPSDLAVKAPTATPDDQAEHESNHNDEASEDHPVLPDSNVAGADSIILLFRERFALYYEPLSLIFEALRADNNVNVEGRFDDNVELVISAPELDLTLPEDNIHSREVSLHDLGVLHNGCELSGPLSLRLDTVSPRFGTRYKAIRDEILRVVSQQEEEERQSQLDPGDGYLVGESFHDSPENDVQGEYEHNLVHENPEVSADSGETYPESSEPQLNESQDAAHGHGTSNSHEGQEPNEENTSDSLASGEYLVYHNYDEGEASNDVEEQDAEEHYAEEDGEEAFEGEYEEDALYDSVEESEQQLNESQEEHEKVNASASLAIPGVASDFPTEEVDVFNDSFPEESRPHADPSTGYITLEDSSNVQETKLDAELTQPTGLQGSSTVAGSQKLETTVSALLDAKPSPTENKSRSGSKTPRESADSRHSQDELIAYEDTVEEGKRTQLLQSGTASRAPSSSSKRSYDEHEQDQRDGADALHDASSESKRLRID